MTTAEWSVTSPDGRLTLTVHGSTGAPAPLGYRITHGDRPVLDQSPLGIEHSGASFTHVTAEVVATRSVRDVYEMPHGKQRTVDAAGSELGLRLTNGAGDRAMLTIRAYDDGAAFRYELDAGDTTSTLLAEHTGFTLPAGRTWIQPHDPPGLATPAYEAEYANGIPTGSATDAPSWNLPALFETDHFWILLAEAGMPPNGFGAHLGSEPDGTTYRIAPPHPGEAMGIGGVWPSFTGRWQSPWRVIVVGETPGAAIETTLITDLSAASHIEESEWVRPGRVAWSWWSDHQSPKSLDALREFVDFAAEMGWEHHLVDANWTVHGEEEINRLVAGAAERGVGTFLWYNSGGPNNEVTEQPRDRMFDADVRRAEFTKLAEWGVAGVKVDFFHSDKPEGMARMWNILEDAAAHQIMVNFHGCTVPRGWSRTWPHLMTMEGVRGAEQYAFAADYPEAAVWHNTVLPFTRNAVGPMDYTPVTFTNQQFPHLTTAAHELALAVIYESGLQHFADSVAGYRSLRSEVLALLRSVPAVWDETRYLAGVPGESCVLARRHDADWWIAGICGPNPMEIEGKLDFVPGHSYGFLVTDGDDGLTTSDLSLADDEPFRVEMRRAGGFLLHIPGE